MPREADGKPVPSPTIPTWIQASVTILLGIAIGVWFSGEATRKLDEEYLIGDMRDEMNRATSLLAGLLAEAVITNDKSKADAVIRQYASRWPELTFIHILGEDGLFFTEWQKRPVKFGEGILKFEQPIMFGDEKFGALSIYADVNKFYRAMHRHIAVARRVAAAVLLSITLLVVFVVNYTAYRETDDGS